MSEQLTPPETSPSISDRDKAFLATNSPALATNEFSFAGRTFKLLNLDYNSYLEFTALLQPLAEVVVNAVVSKAGIGAPRGLNLASSDFSLSGLMKYCGKDLPHMVAICCNMSLKKEGAELVDAAWVIEHAEDPFQLAGIALKQIIQNKMIERATSFFENLLPLTKKLMSLK